MSSLRGGKRKEFSAKVKGAALKRCIRLELPRCENCGISLNARTGVYFDHVTPDGLGGEPTLENCQVLCCTCHSIKTTTEDSPRMAKADRIARKEFGLQPSRKKILSRGFDKASPQKSASRPIQRRQP